MHIKRKIHSLLFLIMLPFFLLAQDSHLSFSRQQMYEDYNQFVQIVRDYNPQINVREMVTGYNVLSRLESLRPQIDSVCSNHDYFKLLENAVSTLVDIHAYAISPTRSPFWMPLYHNTTFKAIDTSAIRSVMRYYTESPASNCSDNSSFSFGSILQYIDGKYYTMGEIVLKGKNSKVKICESILTKVNGENVDTYVYNNLHKQIGAFVRWDHKNRKYYSNMLRLPLSQITFQDKEGNEKNVNLALYPVKLYRLSSGQKKILKQFPKTESKNVVYFDNSRVVYIRIPVMSPGIEKPIIDELFHIFQDYNPEKIVFDVRNNRGGSDEVWINIVERLICDTISFPTCLAVRNQEDIVNYCHKQWQTKLTKYNYFGQSFACVTDTFTLDPDSFNMGFKGCFYVLQDQNTLSAAHSLSSLCRYSDRFISVGIPTGILAGRGVGPSLFQLSNSKFTFAMECDIDFTEISDALDCYQDNPEILVQTSLEEEIMRNFFHPKYIYSEQYLFNKDTFLQSVFNHR